MRIFGVLFNKPKNKNMGVGVRGGSNEYYSFKTANKGKSFNIYKYENSENVIQDPKTYFEGFLDGIRVKRKEWDGDVIYSMLISIKDDIFQESAIVLQVGFSNVGKSLINYLWKMPHGAKINIGFYVSKTGYANVSVYQGGDRAEWAFPFETINKYDGETLAAQVEKLSKRLAQEREAKIKDHEGVIEAPVKSAPKEEANTAAPKSLKAKDFGSNFDLPSADEVIPKKAAPVTVDDDDFGDLPF